MLISKFPHVLPDTPTERHIYYLQKVQMCTFVVRLKGERFAKRDAENTLTLSAPRTEKELDGNQPRRVDVE